MLQRAICSANCTVNAGKGPLKYLTDFPHHLDGGFPGTHPEEASIIYAQLSDGRLAGLTAAATGVNRKTRERGLGWAMMVAAAVQRSDTLGDVEVRHDPDLAELVTAAKDKLVKLTSQQDQRPHTPPRRRVTPHEGQGAPLLLKRRRRGHAAVNELNEMLEQEREARGKLEKDNAELRAR